MQNANFQKVFFRSITIADDIIKHFKNENVKMFCLNPKLFLLELTALKAAVTEYPMTLFKWYNTPERMHIATTGV